MHVKRHKLTQSSFAEAGRRTIQGENNVGFFKSKDKQDDNPENHKAEVFRSGVDSL